MFRARPWFGAACLPFAPHRQFRACFPADPNVVHELDGMGRSGLMYAVHFGHLDTVQILLEQGVDINCTANGKKLLHGVDINCVANSKKLLLFC